MERKNERYIKIKGELRDKDGTKKQTSTIDKLRRKGQWLRKEL